MLRDMISEFRSQNLGAMGIKEDVVGRIILCEFDERVISDPLASELQETGFVGSQW